MEKNAFDIALLLLTVGMGTVFVMLGLVALSSRILINLTNRFAPTLPEIKPALPSIEEDTGISEEEMAIIVATVHTVTGGQGFTVSIDTGGNALKN